MRWLVACEHTQTITRALRAKGHEAFSCDLLDTDGDPAWHIKGDALDAAYNERWDAMIAHPECTYATNAGVRWLFKGGKAPYKDAPLTEENRDEGRYQAMLKAREFFLKISAAPVPRKAIENPVPHAHINLPPFTQSIQPWQFGVPETKRTCLWLHNLPPLKPTRNVYDEMMAKPYSERAKVHYASPGPERWKLRSMVSPGIVAAMVDQWGNA